MLTRLTIVLWWLGAVVGGALMAAPWTSLLFPHCAEVEKANLRRAVAVAASLDRFNAEEACRKMRPPEESVLMPERGTPEWERMQTRLINLQDKIAKAEECMARLPPPVNVPEWADASWCFRSEDRQPMMMTGAAILMACWSLCFVLRGRFFRPPRIPSA